MTKRFDDVFKRVGVLDGFDDSGFEPEDPGGAVKEGNSFLTNEENAAFVAAVQDIVKKYEGPDFPIYMAGTPAVTHFLKQSMVKDMCELL